MTRRGAQPRVLPDGETRKFLEDGDEVILRGYCERGGGWRGSGLVSAVEWCCRREFDFLIRPGIPCEIHTAAADNCAFSG